MRNTIKRSGTVQPVLQALRRDIVMGTLEDGAPVTEIAFAQAYSCSRAALRGALAVLEQEGLVTLHANGTKNISLLTEEDVNNLYRLRSYVECSAAEQFLKHATHDISPLLKVLDQAETDSSEGFFDSDEAFHAALVSLSGNKALMQTWHTFHPLMRELFSVNLLVSGDLAVFFTDRHLKIARRLFNGDGRAIEELASHIEEARLLSVKKFRKE